jgi:hypothetical protein
MVELVTFMDSFDHAPPAWTAAKYTTVQGSSAAVAGPVLGDGRRFAGGGNGLWPALTNEYLLLGSNVFWSSGGWGGHVRISSSGMGSYVVLLQTAWFDQVGEGSLDYVQHELRVYGDGTLRVYLAGVHGITAPDTVLTLIPGAESAAGAFPFDTWCFLEYRTQVRTPFETGGSVAARVDGALAFAATGVTTACDGRPGQARYFRFGNLRGTGAAANSAIVDVDDVCARGDTVAGAAALPWWGTHLVAARALAGPGSRAEHDRSGAATNWEASATLPADPATASSTDTAYVEKWPGETPLAPVDEYHIVPLPVFDPAAGATCWVWGLAWPHPEGGVARVVVRAVDAAGDIYRSRGEVADPPHFRAGGVDAPGGLLTGLAAGQLDGLLVGWGNDQSEGSEPPDTTGDAYVATHLAVELWYAPGEAPPAEPGGQRWSVGWVG